MTVAIALPARASTPTDGWVVWASDRQDGRHEIYLMKSDGTSVKRLTTSGGFYPTFSPDGAWISYHRESANEAWVIRPDAAGDKKIGPGKPVFWMYDGSGLVVQKDFDVYLYNPETLSKSKLWSKTDFSRIAGSSYTKFEAAALTPNKRWLVAATDFYLSGATGDNGTFKHGWGPQLLDLQNKTKIYFVGDGCEGTTSPTSNWVYHVNGEVYPNTRFFKMNTTDAATRSSYGEELDFPEASWGHEYFPRISTDGKWLVYGATTGCHNHDTCDYEIHVHKLGVTGDRTRITTNGSNDQWPHMFIGTLPGCTAATQCGDGDTCTADTCSSQKCVHTPVAGCCSTKDDCGDGNSCTTDSCLANKCVHESVVGCCNTKADCGDGDSCTADSCSANKCVHSPVTGCCNSKADCDDGSACTTDGCSANECTHSPVGGCCVTKADCDDGNACTTDSCKTTTGECNNVQQAGCCAFDTDCDDGDSCTADTCDGSECTNATIADCCTADDQCNDGDACTVDSCDADRCAHQKTLGCCANAVDCDDGNDCTEDTCADLQCTNSPLAACCAVDADCTDSNPCTTDSCEESTGICSNSGRSGCCTDAFTCNDGDSCTLDLCDSSNTCEHQPICGSDAGVGLDPSVNSGHDLGGKPKNALQGGCSLSGLAGEETALDLLLVLVLLTWRRRAHVPRPLAQKLGRLRFGS